MTLFLLIVQSFCSTFMTGVICFVQHIHYPLFSYVLDKKDYHQEHQKRATYLLAPIMALELLVCLILVFLSHQMIDFVSAILLVVIWTCTLTLQVPCHKKLALGQDCERTYAYLIHSNWIRTVAWLAKSMLCFIHLVLYASTKN